MKKGLSELIDIPRLQKLLNNLHEVTGFMCGVINNDLSVITNAGQQDICAKFHRIHPATEHRCKESAKTVFESGAPFLVYKCLNGLYDCACPIMDGPDHLGTLIVGQFLLEQPDVDFFRQQAQTFGFPETEYIEALRKVPVVDGKDIEKVMRLYAGLAEMLTDLGLNRVEQRGMLDFLQQLLDAIPNPIFYKDTAGVYLGCNKAFEKFARHRKQTIVGHAAKELFPPEIVRIYEETDCTLFHKRGVQQYEYNMADHEGRARNLFTNKAAFVNAAGEVAGVVGVITDITAFKDMEQALKESEAKYRALFNHSLSGITYFKVIMGSGGQPVDYEVLEVNTAFERLTGISQQDVAGRLASDTVLDAELNGNWHAVLTDAVLNSEPKTFEYYSPIFQKWLLVSAFSPQAGSLAIVFADINEQKANEEQAKHAARHDALTGLPNRRLLEERLNAAVARAREHSELVAVMFLDLDDFKVLNDRKGHGEGDKILQEVARRIKECTRKEDFVARFGGDEFVLVLPDLKSQSEADAVAQRVLEVFGEPLQLNGEPVSLSVSMGISYFPHDGDDVASLTRSADAAMYASKRTGRRRRLSKRWHDMG